MGDEFKERKPKQIDLKKMVRSIFTLAEVICKRSRTICLLNIIRLLSDFLEPQGPVLICDQTAAFFIHSSLLLIFNHRDFFKRYYLSSAGCFYVCIYVCLCDCSHTVQPPASKLGQNIPHETI